MRDGETTIRELQEQIVMFRAARQWSTNPKDLAITVSVEANELLELFQFNKWQETDVTSEMRSELADVMISCLTLAAERQVDVAQAVRDKLAHMEKKFPLEVFGGGNATDEYHRTKKQYRETQD